MKNGRHSLHFCPSPQAFFKQEIKQIRPVQSKQVFFKLFSSTFWCHLLEHIHMYTRYMYPGKQAGFYIIKILQYQGAFTGGSPFDFIPQRVPIYLTLVRTRRFSWGSQGGTEVEWLDGYSPENTILCASPSDQVSFIHSLIHCAP